MDTELFYFVPGQVILHLEHSEEVTEVLDDQVGIFLSWLEEKHGIKLDLLPERTITFPVISTAEEKKISLVLTQFEIPPMEEYRKEVYTQQDELIALLMKLYDILGEGFYFPKSEDKIFLRFISPNWLTGGAPHLPGVGGPGSWPIPADAPPGNEWKFSFPVLPDSGDFINSSAGEGVNVAILDTAPDPAELSSAHSRWPNHPLVDGLLGSQGMLMKNNGEPNIVDYQFSKEEMLDHTENGTDYLLEPWEHFSLVKHGYEMPDHGLFVAGIIHTIAPQARLKLYEVLNNRGVGSYTSIYTGLASVLEDFEENNAENADHKLIINLSLVLSMPYADDHGFKHFDPGLTDRYAEKSGYFKKMGDSIRDLIEQLVKLDDVLVVAAAGNDAHSQEDRPPARYPAAGLGVIGVGAMPKRSQSIGQRYHSVASYSNLCDEPPSANRPPYSGYVTLGGELGVGQGILGVYIHDFPSHNVPTSSLTHDLNRYNPNHTGWAWWAGTSFATPVISGLLAARWSNNWGLPSGTSPMHLPTTTDRAHNFLSQAAGSRLTQSHRTPANERVIEARQP